MVKKSTIKCPKCRTSMVKKPNVAYTDAFEIGYYCPHCEAYYTFHNWAEYYESCAYEEKEREKKKPTSFNPSVRGSVMKGES